MKAFTLFSAITVLGVLGCGHPQQATRPAANELPYHQPGRFGPQQTPAPEEDATGGAGSPEAAPAPCPAPQS